MNLSCFKYLRQIQLNINPGFIQDNRFCNNQFALFAGFHKSQQIPAGSKIRSRVNAAALENVPLHVLLVRLRRVDDPLGVVFVRHHDHGEEKHDLLRLPPGALIFDDHLVVLAEDYHDVGLGSLGRLGFSAAHYAFSCCGGMQRLSERYVIFNFALELDHLSEICFLFKVYYRFIYFSRGLVRIFKTHVRELRQPLKNVDAHSAFVGLI